MTTPADRDAIRQTGLLINEYATSVILGPLPSTRRPINSASGIFVELEGKHFFVTALHVVERDYKRLKEREPEILAHIGSLQFEPDTRLVFADRDADTAFLALSKTEAEEMGRWIYRPRRWPPPIIPAGEILGIAGYPAITRERQSERQVEFLSYVTQTPVTSVNERQYCCALNRDEWIEVGAPGGQYERNLGGISGGPVFAVNALQPILVGVVAEYGDNFDILYAGRLDRATRGDLGLPAA